MNQAFYKLRNEKQKKIIDSAYQVFTDTPYEQASTNDIVKIAGISKGRLFYYFNNKLSLFLFLIDHAMSYIENTYLSQLNFVEKDYLSRYEKLSIIKKKAYEKEPHLFAFISYVNIHKVKQVPVESYEAMQAMTKKAVEAQYKDIDITLFRSDIDPNQVMDLITYSLEGYQNKLIETFKKITIKEESMEKHYQDYDEFLKLLRKIYYQ